MKEQEKRLLRLISLDVTSQCNLRCMHCYNASGSGLCSDMPAEELLRVAREIAAMRPMQVCLCGGEPTLCPVLMDILDILRGNVCRISMVSNGLKITPEFAKALRERGVFTMQISLDGAYAWQHDSLRGRNGAFDAALRAIRHLREAGVTVAASIIPNKLNCRSLPEYFRLCAELGVAYVRSMPFLPTGRGAELGKALQLNAEEYFQYCSALQRLGSQYAAILHTEWDDPVRSIHVMREQNIANSLTATISILADGTVTQDLYLPFSAGNIRGRSLEQMRQRLTAGWLDPRVNGYVDALHHIYDFERLEPSLYAGESVDLFASESATEETE